MASLTVRQLDEQLKKRLRLRAASNGRSMEDEVRICCASGRGRPGAALDMTSAPDRAAQRERAPPPACRACC